MSDSQVRDLIELYQNEWWTRGREPNDVQRMLDNTDLVVGFCDGDSQKLIAFARVLTDRVYKALILDVIVAPEHRGRDLGMQLMQLILDHPDLQGVRHFELYCLPELVPFYERWGFSVDDGRVRFMRKTGTSQ